VQRAPLALQHSPWVELDAPVQLMPLQQSAWVAQALPPGAQQTLAVQAPTQQSVAVWQDAWSASQQTLPVQP
jgi:hypothetical protein